MAGEPERRGDERSEAPRSGGSPAIVRAAAPIRSTDPDPEVTARRARRRFTTPYKLEILRTADACTRPGQLVALLRREGCYSSHLITWRRQREAGLTPKKRGRPVTADPRVKQLEREKAGLETTTRRLARRLQRAETIIAFQKKPSRSASAALPAGPEAPDAGIVARPRGEWPFAFWWRCCEPVKQQGPGVACARDIGDARGRRFAAIPLRKVIDAPPLLPGFRNWRFRCLGRRRSSRSTAACTTCG